MTEDGELEAIVVGGGPAGLATSAELSRRGVGHVVLERGDQPGFNWANLYDSLTLHTGRHMSTLPGMRFEKGTGLFPRRVEFVRYLHAYARTFAVPLRTGVTVTMARRDGEGWRLTTNAGPMAARALVWATGIIASPRVPEIAGQGLFRGRLMHSVEYRRPATFLGRRVLVVGVGNSGGEIASELARAGVETSVAVRSGANVVPLQLAGIPIQYLSYALRKLPRRVQEGAVSAIRRISERRRGPPVLPRPPVSPLDAIPLIGFHLDSAIREGLVAVRPGIAALTPLGARFTDGSESRVDDVILATGFTPALAPLAGQLRTDAKGFALRTDRVTSADQPGLWFVGHNYDATGGLFNIRRDAPVVAERVAEFAGGRG